MKEQETFNKIMDELLFNTVKIYQYNCSNLNTINVFEEKHKDLSLKCDINFIFGGIIDYSDSKPTTEIEITTENISNLEINSGVMLYCTALDKVISFCDFKNDNILVNKYFILNIFEIFSHNKELSGYTSFEISKLLIPYLKFNMNFKNKQLLIDCYNKFNNQ